MKVNINLLDKKMTRREFLSYMGILLVTITGIVGLMKSVSNISTPRIKKGNNFGSGPYGV